MGVSSNYNRPHEKNHDTFKTMKIKFEKYNPNWSNDFKRIKTELTELIGFINPIIEHIGSTSVEGLSAKPIIDILIGVKDESYLEKTIAPLNNKNYVYYERYNEDMPYRRFFVKHKIDPKELSIPSIITDKDYVPSNTNEHNQRLAHIHILPFDSEHWIRHIAFRDYLRTHLDINKNDEKTLGILTKCNYKIGKFYNAIDDIVEAQKYFNKCLKNTFTGFGVGRYKLKSAIELCKILLKTEQYDDINKILKAVQLGNENIVRKYPEILDEINLILEKVGSETTYVFGKITYVNTISDYVIIESNENPEITFIAGKVNFIPILNSLSQDLKSRKVQFVTKIFKSGGKEKREAKNIKIIA